MNKISIDATTDDAGTLRIQIPGRPSRYHVHVTIEWDGPAQASQWPPGWIDATAGSITDPTFVRHAQGSCEQREKLE